MGQMGFDGTRSEEPERLGALQDRREAVHG
jgi:hypothetical protein